MSRKGLQVLLAGWRVGGGRVTVLSTKGPRASRHGHLRTWTACANRCPEVSFPPAGRRQCRPTFPRSSPAALGLWNPRRRVCPRPIPRRVQWDSTGSLTSHTANGQPSPPKKANMHFLTGQRPGGLFVAPIFGRSSRHFVSIPEQNHSSATISHVFSKRAKLHLGQSRGDIIHLECWGGGGERGVFYQPHLGDAGDQCWRFKTGHTRDKKGGKEENGVGGNLLP